MITRVAEGLLGGATSAATRPRRRSLLDSCAGGPAAARDCKVCYKSPGVSVPRIAAPAARRPPPLRPRARVTAEIFSV
ncbi:hypothetical protein EVAR_32154_1 [Eumeta japonica]|uniref:Uncharacterized protein n=1 Tax=Eumeta variegata TaxID=151549 RepID=A0A4C1VX43_EUMVA|nr:hypothetical protein EVAR_32154_1 [Eumeta japonica]